MKTLQKIIIVILMLVTANTMLIIGYGIGLGQQDECTRQHISGKIGTESEDAYTIEMWDNGTVRIITKQEYINQLPDGTVIVRGE